MRSGDSSKATDERLVLIDTSNHLHSDWYAVSDGAYDQFLARLRAMRKAWRPDRMVCCLDVGKSFRKSISDDYKSGRKPKPDGLVALLESASSRLLLDGFSVASASGYEAEDVIATLAARWRGKVIICSSDKDVRQLLEAGRVTICRKFSREGMEWITQDSLYAETGLTPHQYVEMQALAGDCTDGIAGASGIGEVTATKLLRKHGTLDYLVKYPFSIAANDSQRKSIIEFGKSLADWRKLVELKRDVPVHEFEPKGTSDDLPF